MQTLNWFLVVTLVVASVVNLFDKTESIADRIRNVVGGAVVAVLIWSFFIDHRSVDEIARADRAAAAAAKVAEAKATEEANKTLLEAARAEGVIETCRNYAREQAVHRSTVDFERELPPKLNDDGSAVVGLRFSVKNTYGLELSYGLLCVVTPDGKPTGLVFDVDR